MTFLLFLLANILFFVTSITAQDTLRFAQIVSIVCYNPYQDLVRGNLGPGCLLQVQHRPISKLISLYIMIYDKGVTPLIES